MAQEEEVYVINPLLEDRMHNDDTQMDLSELHGNISNIIVIPDREFRCSAQEIKEPTEHEPPEHIDREISEVPRKTSNITQLYNKTNDEFKKVTIVIVHGLIYNEDIGKSHESKYLRVAQKLTVKMREDSSTHFKHFVTHLRRAFENSRAVEPKVWFAVSFQELIAKVGERPSWRTFLNVLNCISIIREVAAEFYDEPLKTMMEQSLVDFILNHFRLYITSCGGWNDLIEFWRHAEEIEKESTESSWFATAFFVIVGIVGYCTIKNPK